MKKFFAGFSNLSLIRTLGLMQKEFIVIRRDKGSIAMILLIPLMQLILFGYAIIPDPKHLPTIIISYDNSPLTRDIVGALQSSQYFSIVKTTQDEEYAKQQMAIGRVNYIITIPPTFTRDLIRGNNPQMLVEFDGSDSSSNGGALSSIPVTVNQAVANYMLQGLNPNANATLSNQVNVINHRSFNEENINPFNVIPGLIGALLTMTLVIVTASAITNEAEVGTMETLLTTPLLPVEIILGKVLPYVVLGYTQLSIVLIAGKLLFDMPMLGSLVLLYIASAPFILGNLMIGMIFSVIAKTQLQAVQLGMFYQLPSMFFSGYLFSFYGMPQWAQWVGSVLPMTYFIRMTRGILLKGNELEQVMPNLIPISIISLVFIVIASRIFRRTLD